MNPTKERILDTAERLFAEQGYTATSLRGIIAEAEVNLAAVHYHFHSKEALLEAVILRRSVPANRERLILLDRCEQAAGNRPPSLEQVIEAFVAPTFRMARDPASGRRSAVRYTHRPVPRCAGAFRRRHAPGTAGLAARGVILASEFCHRGARPGPARRIEGSGSHLGFFPRFQFGTGPGGADRLPERGIPRSAHPCN